MDNCWGRSGVFGLVLAALLLVFNWPLMSIPGPGHLLGWLFAAWAAAIVLLGLAARGVSTSCLPPEADSGPPTGENESGPGDV